MRSEQGVALLLVAIIPPLRPEAITGSGDPRSMVPVRSAGEEVATTFWAKLAGRPGARTSIPLLTNRSGKGTVGFRRQ